MKNNYFIMEVRTAMDIDIYFNTNYGKLYEKIENGVCKI